MDEEIEVGSGAMGCSRDERSARGGRPRLRGTNGPVCAGWTTLGYPLGVMLTHS
jgi:hypothetical protein